MRNAEKQRKYCPGCRDDFYNDHNGMGIKECLHLASSKVVWLERYVSIYSRTPIKTRQLNCFKVQL